MKKVSMTFITLMIAFTLVFLGCSTGGSGVGRTDDSVLNFWLVHEMYPDTQRLTKMIIDAGEGKSFKADEINTETFTVEFETRHWHPLMQDTHGFATEAGVGYGNRIIEDAYVIDDLPNALITMERRELTEGQTKLPKSSTGRYLVLQFYSERELREAGFVFDPVGYALNGSGVVGEGPSTGGFSTAYQKWQRTPGAESGWNGHADSFHQNKHVYTVQQNAPFHVYRNGTAAAVTSYTFEKAPTKYNNNEIVTGEIQVTLNNFEAHELDVSNVVTDKTGRNDFIKYRLMKPLVGSGKQPLVVVLHGSDGRRIRGDDVLTYKGEQYWGDSMNTGVKGEFEFLQNHGQLINTSGPAQWGSRAHQEKYGGYYVLAPQGHEIASHVAEDNKAVIDYVVAHYDVDPTRIYVMGHSNGGRGTHSLIAAYPNFFAAGVPQAGAEEFDTKTQQFITTPMWYFAIRGDTAAVNCVAGYNAIKNAGGNVRLTYYPVNGYLNGFPNGATPDIHYFDYAGGADRSGTGNYGFRNDPVEVPAGRGWEHSSFEPANSDLVTTSDQWNVGFTNTDNNSYTGNGDNSAYLKFQWGYKHPNDTAGQSLYAWLFSQKRENPNSNSIIDLPTP